MSTLSPTALLLIVGMVLFTLISGFFSASETALFSLSPMAQRAYRKSESRKKRLMGQLLSHPRNLLVTLLIMNIISNIFVQNFASEFFASSRGWLWKVGLPLVATLLFGEIIPKTIALPNNERIASIVAPIINFFHRILSPFRRMITYLTNLVSRVMFFFLRPTKEISRQELLHALRRSEEHGVLTSDESELIAGYLSLQGLLVKELSRPREEVLFYPLSEPLSKLTYLFSDLECSRVPVCNGGIENIAGIMEARDFFLHRNRFTEPNDLLPFLRKPMYVPENTPAMILLRRFRDEGHDIAIVVDEYGSISGLIAWEDLVEMIVGEISDRRDQKQAFFATSQDAIIANGTMELAGFNEYFNVYLKSEHHLATLGGWLTEQLGLIPKVGTKLICEGFLFQVLAATPTRINSLYARKLPPPTRRLQTSEAL